MSTQSGSRAALTEEQRIEGYHENQPFGRNPKPFIAAVNGLAIGAGMERAADCDIRIASTEAYFGLFEVKRGILANYAINNLARVLPHAEAVYLMLSGDTLSVEDAHRLGFVHQILEPEELMPRAEEIAAMIGSNAPLAVQGAKTVAPPINRGGGATVWKSPCGSPPRWGSGCSVPRTRRKVPGHSRRRGRRSGRADRLRLV